jgi:hypothetical protein
LLADNEVTQGNDEVQQKQSNDSNNAVTSAAADCTTIRPRPTASNTKTGIPLLPHLAEAAEPQLLSTLLSPFQPDASNIPPMCRDRNYYFQNHWFADFKWLHFDTHKKRVLCFYCMSACNKGLILNLSKVETAFTIDGFSNWKKGNEKFMAHEKSDLHRESVLKLSASKQAPIDAQLSRAREKEQKNAYIALRAIVTSVMFLARQGLALRGHENDEGNFQQLLNLRAKDIPELQKWLIGAKKHYTTADVQNELLQIMAHAILRDITSTIREAKYYSLIVDETADISGIEQVSLCLRYVDDNFCPHEAFLGLYQTANTTADAITSLILDSLTRFGLSLDNLRGQCYDGAANMSGINKGVQAKLSEKQPLAVYVHCANHSLNLALQDTTKSVQLIRDCLQMVNDIGVLIRDSPKRLQHFADIAVANDASCSAPRPLCPTRWSVRVEAINGILRCYEVLLLQLNDLSQATDDAAAKAHGLHEKLDKSETLLALYICQEIFTPAELLSKTLQNSTMSVSGALEAAKLVIHTLESKRSEEHYDFLWNKMVQDGEQMELVAPQLPRQRKKSTRLQFDYGHATSAGHQFNSAKDYYRKSFFEAMDAVITEMKDRFDQPGFAKYEKLEKSLLTSVDNFLADADLTSNCASYGFDMHRLPTQLGMIRQLMPNGLNSLCDAVERFQSLHAETRSLLSEVESLIKVLLVIPASSAHAERSFSMLRRLKTHMRSTMTQARLNYVCVLNCYQEKVDNLDVDKICQLFINNDYRRSVFGNGSNI